MGFPANVEQPGKRPPLKLSAALRSRAWGALRCGFRLSPVPGGAVPVLLEKRGEKAPLLPLILF